MSAPLRIQGPAPRSHAAAQQPAWSPRALLGRARAETASPLPAALQQRLQSRLGHDFGHVRIHAGPRSAAAADAMGARAYTLGCDVHLGRAAAGLDPAARERLLAHEAIHTVQQGAAAVAPSGVLGFGQPGDAAEREAQALAVHGGPARIRQSVSPRVQCDLTDGHELIDGKFKMGLKKEEHAGAKSGLKGTIKFTADAKAPDAASIRLLQIVRVEDLDAGKDWEWTGAEADRNKVRTTEDSKAGVQPGFFVDHSAAAANPRTAKADKAVSPYYRDYWPNATNSQDGSKAGATVTEASLWDYPGANRKMKFTFETVAMGVDKSYTYGVVHWGFTLTDPAKGTVADEFSKARNLPSANVGAAKKAFDVFYKNPGTPDAPTT
ncbi:eCIS core domain-containing protein [Pseudorhodoferax sp.]|uniref:eCIS core domain-containing protein n=1 Tax=Pseudorhodoferax sp. TaxID=1993553 RepID=UPI002DD6ABD7|nr:DUF4157 domain-containing protein [Pseudorhodoferax sp.]